MFFVLSKFLAFLIYPSSWIILCFLFGYFFKKKRTLLYWTGVILAIVFTNGLVFRFVINQWEGDFKPLTSFENKAESVVILGGFSGIEEESSRVFYNAASDRFWQGLSLFYKGYVDRVVISGGSAAILYDETPESVYLKEQLLEMRFSEDSLLIEGYSRNTYENALYTGQLFDSLKIDKEVILVTSAFHMRRAQMCFEKQGFEVTALRVHPMRNIHPITPTEVIVPSAEIMYKWGFLIKEWIGVVAYKLKGYV